MERNLEPLSVSSLKEDGISVLPDDILVAILSTLKFKEAVQTSVLSHRWLNLWRHVPRLHFDCMKHLCPSYSNKKWMEARALFADWVNRVLESHQSSNLLEFRIFFNLDNTYQKEIDKWLHYAFDKRLQCLDLNLSRLGHASVAREDSYDFSSQLINQTTQFGVQQPAAKVGFSCLKALYFTAVKITGEAIEQLLVMCPLLEDLRVVGSTVLTNLMVSGPSLSLKHLEIFYCRYASLTISDTNLVSLKLSTTAKRHLLFINLPMLVDVDVMMHGNFPDKSILFSQLSCCLSQLTVLTIRASSPSDIMKLYKIPELQNLRRMVLAATLCGEMSQIGLTSLIDSCPRLVEFVLRLNPLEELRKHLVQKKAMEKSLKGLKVFELHGYHGNTYESELIMFFIENAFALEKIVIDPHFILDSYFDKPDDKRTKDSRKHAIEKFEGAVPKHVELVIL